LVDIFLKRLAPKPPAPSNGKHCERSPLVRIVIYLILEIFSGALFILLIADGPGQGV
jgi:hypothetical protein